jgi:hypothetical protein
MSGIGTVFKTRLEHVLDQICAGTPDGGSHEMRRFIAERLMTAARREERSLERLTEVARQALEAFRTRAITTTP